jgi:ABC-2 type transport system permease protein
LAIFLVFGLGSPLIAKYTPQLLSSIEGAELFADLIPEPTTADALNQYIRNLTQFGFLIAILLGMGAVAGEKERGTAPMILSKPLPRWAFVLSKFTAQALVYALGFALAAVGAALYTALLFDGLDMAAFMLGNVLLLIWLLAYVAITLLGSTLTSSTGAAAGVSLGGAILILLLGSIPQLSMIMPSALVGIASQAGLPDVTLPSAAAPVVATLSLILICLITAVGAFDAQEL